MELYVLKDKVQDAVDYANGNLGKEILSIVQVSRDMLICPQNQSIPEKYFKKLDCDFSTTTRRTYLIGITLGDIVMSYVGEKRDEVKDFIIDYASKKSGAKDIRMALRDEKGGKCLVYAPIKGGIEIAIYGNNNLHVGNKDLDDAVNTNKKDCSVSLEELVEAIEREFGVEHRTQLPKEANYSQIKNSRGILTSCMTGKTIFNIKKKVKRIRVPMVFDEDINSFIPKTSLSGFGGLNNTKIENGFYEGDLTIYYQDEEELETEKLIKEKGGVEWLG